VTAVPKLAQTQRYLRGSKEQEDTATKFMCVMFLYNGSNMRGPATHNASKLVVVEQRKTHSPVLRQFKYS
jgi:hypothetical protein